MFALKAAIALFVLGPTTPSIVPGSKPWYRRRNCAARALRSGSPLAEKPFYVDHSRIGYASVNREHQLLEIDLHSATEAR